MPLWIRLSPAATNLIETGSLAGSDSLLTADKPEELLLEEELPETVESSICRHPNKETDSAVANKSDSIFLLICCLNPFLL